MKHSKEQWLKHVAEMKWDTSEGMPRKSTKVGEYQFVITTEDDYHNVEWGYIDPVTREVDGARASIAVIVQCFFRGIHLSTCTNSAVVDVRDEYYTLLSWWKDEVFIEVTCKTMREAYAESIKGVRKIRRVDRYINCMLQ